MITICRSHTYTVLIMYPDTFLASLDQQVDLPSLQTLQVEQANLHQLISEVQCLLKLTI